MPNPDDLTKELFISAMRYMITGMQENCRTPEIGMQFLQHKGPEWMVDNFLAGANGRQFFFTKWIRDNKEWCVQTVASLIGSC